MASSEDGSFFRDQVSFNGFGLFWLAVATIMAGWFFIDGLDALLLAWQTPEYSHGPLIPLLSAMMFLRELKIYPPREGPVPDRWPGVLVIVLAFAIGALGKLARIDDIVAYATIIWVGGIILVSFGWSQGWKFWPSVLHLVYMLPLPATIYYKVSISLQMISSELGVGILKVLSVPVFLEGNIIDLGVMRLHVAEACSGLRYLFPIMSFSYIFAVLYRGPVWHKAVLLLAAVPITVLMNSVRIAVAGIIANQYGVEWLEGFTHFFEGWVIFLICILLLFGLARLMLLFHPGRPSLADALDLDTSNMLSQLGRLRGIQASKSLIAAALLGAGALMMWQVAVPERDPVIQRASFALFPRELGEWEQRGPEERLTVDVERVLKADDYRQATFTRDDQTPAIGFFSAFYNDQTKGGVHSPEICLPSAGWEIAKLDRVDIGAELGSDRPFPLNRAIIQRGETRMMVYYWFQQGERRVAWDIAAKFNLLLDGIRRGQTDGGIIRLTTPMERGESEESAEARLMEMTRNVVGVLPRFIPES
ncbi:VPLPA-CTERM-specific exosortase XrtD [Paracoccus sp. 1_MG-2023]|uniref:VPLPA-CTERM-specific exosortase XrtD n=1 Tax=unclassified Paracoccus (in: a-proteobacteria) TaxID=2688777 RepID=UPI001C08E088|nr:MULTISPECIES: VPLPA-CTERM-specific exosortase XrtD [unclassified Paracoccus (in: a-proteobacteria)]MBU2958934.1 VPLPA-CTERM-specific exosortase XrtD [Paracoccus sp. C2R09]MDO6669976.1 VPLPA-CTERM-specific exosortase XrtD [Paracoccus sp. 1_MG-2023]